jgi:DNA-binding response OmpR family regulator/predicted Ser/Thr protein kinase
MIRLGKILLVDDDEHLLKLMERTLVRLGYEVHCVSSAEDAVERLSNDPHDLVISDMYMQGASGIDLIETIRAAGLDADVIMLSGQSRISTVVEAMRLGARNYLEKPLDLDALKSAVREVFKSRQAKKDSIPPTATPATPAPALSPIPSSSISMGSPMRSLGAPFVARADQTQELDPGETSVPQQARVLDPSLPVSTPPNVPRPPPMARDRETVTQEIGRYRLLERIGAGAMGTVHRALDTVLHRAVALKVFSLRASEQEYVERFRREAMASASLNHPNIATVFDYGEINGSLFIAMEHVQGTSLDALLRDEKRLPVARVINLAFQLVDALDHAHQLGIVHRDVKPANILLTTTDRVKLVDFGVAHIVGSDLTGAGLMLGSPSYMSPESAGGKVVDYRADQFSLATVMYEAVTGDRPFKSPELIATIRNVITKETAAFDTFGLNAPELEEILQRLHSKEPEFRWQNESELLDELAKAGRVHGLNLQPALPRAR